jgi:Fe2+ or Zn2+ uptake regulation protein
MRNVMSRVRHRLAHLFGVNGVRLESEVVLGGVTLHRLTGETVYDPEVEMYVAHLVCAVCGERTHFVTKPLWRAI